MPKKKKYKNPANPEMHKAMMELRRSSAATPQETKAKRLRTKQAIIADEIKKEE